MALSALAKKQGWLIDNGHPKSYAYFMTGPNLGADFDVDKLVAGSYSQIEINGFVTDTQGAYNAHKGKAKVKAPAKAPGAVPITGNACAKGAAKAVNTWVTAGQELLATYINKVGSKFVAKNIPAGQLDEIFDEIVSMRKKAKALVSEAVDEVGLLSPEVNALKRLDDSMIQAQLSIDAKRAADQIILALDEGNIHSVRSRLFQLKLTREKFKSFDFEDIAPLWDNALDSKAGVTMFQDIQGVAFDALEDQNRRAIGSVLQAISEEVDDFGGLPVFDDFAQIFNPEGKIGASLYDDVTEKIITLGEVPADLLDADLIVSNLKELDIFNAAWNDFLGLDGSTDFPTAQLHEFMGKLLQKQTDLAVVENVQAYSTLVNRYANGPGTGLDNFWLTADDTGATALEFWANKAGGTDINHAILVEFNEIDDLMLKLTNQGAFSEKVFDFTQDVLVTKLGVVSDVLDDAIKQTGLTLPGFSATPKSVLDKLSDPGYVKTIQEAGTDELNPLVTEALQELEEPGSLTYFMTKKQKVDFLTDPNFGITEYVVKYKGDTLTGTGLQTAKTKYAAKNGNKIPKQSVPKATKTGADPITGTKAFTLPDGAPGWWADDATDAQVWFIENHIKKNPDDTATIQASLKLAFGDDATVANLKKGQISPLIGKIKDGDFVTTDDMASALSFGKGNSESVFGIKSVKLTGISEPDVDDIAKVVKAVENGPTLAGTTQSTSKAAADFVDWDTPHTYTYVGDGKGKWGGAHRKWHFTDEEGSDWMLKHGELFRSEGELAAHKIANAAGFDVAEARITRQTVAGRGESGFMQKMYPKSEIKGDLSDVMTGARTFQGIDDDIARQVQEHQVLDWVLGNHDAHTQNFLVMADGRVVGIDKGQAFKLYGKDKLAHDFKHSDNFGTNAYNTMWDDYRAGRINLDLNSIDDALRRVEDISDEVMEKLVRDYADGRFLAGDSQAFLRGTSAESADELVALVLERKRTIRKQFTEFYQDNAKARGETFSPKWASDIEIKLPTKPVRVLKPGESLTLIDDAFTEGLHRAGTAGKSVYVSGSEVERGQVLFDLVKDSKGNEVLRVNVTLRPEADARLVKLIQEESGVVASRATAAPLPSTPAGVTEAGGWNATTINGAKTINHHISAGDFSYNAQSLTNVDNLLDTVKATESRLSHITNPDSIRQKTINEFVDAAKGKGDDAEAFVIAALEREAADHTQLRAAQTYRSHLEEIAEQGVKGSNAVKVSNVPDFDAVKHYEKVKDSAVKRARKSLDVGIEKHVEVKAPKKVFTSVKTERVHTYQIDQRSPGRIAKLANDERQIIGASLNNTSFRGLAGEAGDEIEMLYRTIDGNVHTQQGWMELIVKTDGTVDTADVQRAFDFLSDELGIRMNLADSVDMELTYWRTLQGNYKSSIEAGSSTSKYAKALNDADDALRALGPNPSREQEIDAIRDAWRGQFGRIIDDADTLPIHNHALTAEADEYGWGFFERPELGDLSDLDGFAVRHTTRAGDGEIESHFMEGATGDGMFSQSERQRYGFKASSMSGPEDINTGGASGFFGRLGPHSQSTNSMVIINPARVHRRMGNYNANADTYGNLSYRKNQNHLSPGSWKRYGGNRGNEVMMRDGISYMDDIEITFFSKNVEAQAAVKSLKARGIHTIRGVAVEERFVSVANTRAYSEKFFRNHVRATGGYKERMRRAVGDITAKATKRLEDFAAAASRLKLKKGAGSARILAKKLSAGRQAESYFTSFGQRQSMAMRYHDAENAVSFSLQAAKQAGWLVDNTEDALSAYMSQFADDFDWAITGKQRFKRARQQFDDEAFVIDLTSMGIDLRDITKFERPQMLRELSAALNKGQDGIEAFKKTWGALAKSGII